MVVLNRIFGNFERNVDYKQYFECVQRFVSNDVVTCNEILFKFLDVNKDNKVCETDLFSSLKTLNTPQLLDFMSDDILVCMNLLEEIRFREGKSDAEKIKRDNLRKKIEDAIE